MKKKHQHHEHIRVECNSHSTEDSRVKVDVYTDNALVTTFWLMKENLGTTNTIPEALLMARCLRENITFDHYSLVLK